MKRMRLWVGLCILSASALADPNGSFLAKLKNIREARVDSAC